MTAWLQTQNYCVGVRQIWGKYSMSKTEQILEAKFLGTTENAKFLGQKKTHTFNSGYKEL